jgi:hypothetical protein
MQPASDSDHRRVGFLPKQKIQHLVFIGGASVMRFP